LRDLIRSADAAFTNFETTTPSDPVVPVPAPGLAASSPPFVIDELTALGFNLFALANNQTWVYGWQGVRDTLDEFRRRGLVVAGAGRTLADARAPAYLDAGGGRVALVAATITSAEQALAADPGRHTEGRPGANPLRHTLHH
jgi:poly-gamma-glutamate synthesis protein (capsule biosynthesis protein)